MRRIKPLHLFWKRIAFFNMFIKNIHVSLCSINLCLENGPGKKCIWKCSCQIHQIRWIKYKYMVWNLIKYKYKYAVFVFVFANTNTYLTPALVLGEDEFINNWIIYRYIKAFALCHYWYIAFILSRYFGEGTCRFGERCSQAHSEAELNEWRERFEFRRQRLQHAKDNDLHSNTYAEQLLERWMNAENPESIVSGELTHWPLGHAGVTLN